MATIVLARIDDRLIHGQVMTAWLQYVGANHIVIIDDETASDDFLKSIIEMAVPREIKLHIYHCEEAAAEIKKMSDDEKLMILAKVPESFLTVIETGLPLEKIIIGGMGANTKRTKFYKNISASDTERETFKKITAHGTKLVIHIIPDQQAVGVEEYLK
ncbi:PTS sugar transporter subunit IIB [Pelosinus propionicus]|uniref:PTS system, mannose-specific IIB component n=1 Tax=Pelosinus propionicus DSM 13327 TaxID=1123291 RepID=A0A1I4GY10_9FIRM|nr:PTS sugar transporter subunit IIB [Pelosinus propionicus]SFL34839.1 PTS system, mannose-specific IIB component [Pelosinus propionicus DSM 13327]